jgi:DNA-binding PadR family transcriptional regulator
MGRIFGKGELPRILLAVIDSIGGGNGYAIMQVLQQRVGGGWKASPGAIYPALLSLESAGLVRTEEQDGIRVYRLTDAGRAAAARELTGEAWESLSARAEANTPPATLVGMIRDFQAQLPEGRVALTDDQAARMSEILSRAAKEISNILDEGGSNG